MKLLGAGSLRQLVGKSYSFFFFTWKRRVFLGFIIFFCIFIGVTTRSHLTGHLEGLYLLKNGPFSYVIKDDYFLGDESRLVYSLSFEPFYNLFRRQALHRPGDPYLEFEWEQDDGSGFIINHLSDGSKVLTCFSRYLDSDGRETFGLFVGGGLPSGVDENDKLVMNETGMALYNGQRWNHIWCNVNESIAPALNPANTIPPSSWKFLGSRILKQSSQELVLLSQHEVVLNGAPLLINRYAFFKAGERFFTLAIRMVNRGEYPVGYYYVYGDEPWVGNFGSSRGNVGWAADRLFYYEGVIDTAKYSHAGMYDGGNKMVPEDDSQFTGLANFIDWQAGIRPDVAYFSNTIGSFAPESKQVPLSSKDNRVMMLQWGPKMINPRQVDMIVLSIGIADKNPRTGLPQLPLISYLQRDLDLMLATER